MNINSLSSICFLEPHAVQFRLLQRRKSKMEILVCPLIDCHRPFQVNRFDAAINIGHAAGVMSCPHCGSVLQGEAGSVYLTHALSKEEEVKFHAHCKAHA